MKTGKKQAPLRIRYQRGERRDPLQEISAAEFKGLCHFVELFRQKA
ncbi:MAG: hypothetical protein NDJ90_09890 [Oligoflexia bacterium]|nr:hypothetical protein [Oligoflexia bacterium]